ncbi:SDR family oxidoreductase [Oceanidesulfovibrio marinus]|uniref:SDR family oxidoreductase n=1 Tax=Oceanidesulfovibrio marinus TaxID=370038 RepID=UPI0022A83831|nr:SDR family oxidoreductase [Oceanidesulfovibrio marinus]
MIGSNKSAALAYAEKGIRINEVCTGIIDTPMVADMKESEGAAIDELIKLVPIARLGLPGEIASAVRCICSHGAAYVLGHALVVDGGYTIQ